MRELRACISIENDSLSEQYMKAMLETEYGRTWVLASEGILDADHIYSA